MPCILEYTDERFVYSGKYYPGVPLLVDSDFHFVDPVCDYLRTLVIHRHLAVSTVRTYAQIIQNFWNFLEGEGLHYAEITDAEFQRWVSRMDNKGNKDYVSGQRCDAVFDLYCWLEKNGWTEYMIKIPGHNDDQRFTPRLSSKPAKSRHYRASTHGIVWGDRPAGKDADQVQHTPTTADLTALYVAADESENPDLTERNHLIIDWYAQVGLRRTEAIHLTVDQIPGWEEIDELRSNLHAYELLLVKTKGQQPRYVGVLPTLLEKTREWIEGPRANLIRRFKNRKTPGYKEPRAVFLSAKTGECLTETAVSNYFTSIFGKANVRGHGHRIRAHYLQKLIDAEVEAAMAALVASGGSGTGIDWELIIHKVAERAGHKDTETLKKYVTLVKKKHSRRAGRDEVVTMTQLLAAQKQELAVIESQLTQRKLDLSALKSKMKVMKHDGSA